ncbi:MAG: aspartate aminotransferase [Myxococcota bacterium]|jgi:aspartate aminotransferase
MIPHSLNLNLRGLPQSATLRINARSKAMMAEGRTIYRFGLGQSPFPVPEPVVEALRAHAAEKDYLPVEGLPALRVAVANFHRQRDLAAISPDGVIIGPGSKELMFLLQLAFYGDLLVPTPCWVSYGPQARILGRHVKLLPTSFQERWRLSAERLARLCEADRHRPRLLILNTPGNPDGDSYTDRELRAIAEVAREHGVIVLSDEIYGMLHHTGAHRSIARYYPEGTIISGGLSKWCGAGGWRLGTMAFPAELHWLKDAMAAAASETYTSVTAPVQYAAVTAFELGPQIEDYLAHARRILAALGTEITARLRSSGLSVHPPTGAFYLWLDLSMLSEQLAAHDILDSPTLCERLLTETGVALLPGASFERPVEELTARMAYVDFDGAAALAISRQHPLDEPLPLDALSEACGPVLEGVDCMCRWLTDSMRLDE